MAIFTDRNFQHQGSDLRRAITAAFPDNEQLHNHLETGDYRLPPIRFCIADECPSIVAINDGIEVLDDIYRELSQFRVHHDSYNAVGKELFDTFEPIAHTENRHLYQSQQPWIALNAANFERYQTAKSEQAKEEVLQRVIIGNILALSKSVGYFVPGQVEVTLIQSEGKMLIHKGVRMIGFRILFSTNMLLPSWLGIGKLVSKGFGLLKRLE